MLAKFLLIIYIGKYLSIDELGEYGLFVTTITIAIYFLGLDFYTYNTREILAKDKNERLPLIRDQFIFHLLVYVIVLPLLLTVFTFGLIATEFIIYFYLILVFEHLSQELYRLYTTLQKPIFANFLLFMRTGLWVYAVIVLWYLNVEGMMNLKTVWYGWAVGSFISIIIGIVYLKRDYDFKSLTEKIDWYWIKNGVKVSIPFFIGTLAYKVIEFSDRYMIDYYMTKADVGIYTFYGSIANTMQTIVFTLVIMIYYPKMIELYKNSRIDAFNKMTNKFFWEVLIYSIITILGIVLFIYPVLEYLDKVEFVENLSILWILLGATLVLNLSFVPHYILFVKHKDIAIRNITLIGAGLNIVLNIFMIQNYGVNGAAIATAISFGAILLIKYINTLGEKVYE
ncbi:MAG: oligosaccharide flippase family protein [Bacteroidales bacterium]|nr:oligosaccharide flippase family protein [Bacteroidales bacterium]